MIIWYITKLTRQLNNYLQKMQQKKCHKNFLKRAKRFDSEDYQLFGRGFGRSALVMLVPVTYLYYMMREDQEYIQGKGQYSKITYKKRLRLIDMIEKSHYSVYRAAKQLGISNSTAKLIIKHYREEGHIFRKKMEEKRPEGKPIGRRPKNRVPVKEEAQLLIQVIKEQECESTPRPQGGAGFSRILKDLLFLNNCELVLQMHSSHMMF